MNGESTDFFPQEHGDQLPVFVVGSGIFKSNNPEAFAKAIVEATANYDKPEVLAEVSKGLGEAMKGLEMSTLSEADRMQDRGI